MKLQLRKHLVWVAGGLVLLMAGCGGGGGGGGGGGAGTGSNTTAVTVTVVDGPIRGATVCLDRNNNGVCEAVDEPRLTDSNGQVNFVLPNAEVGKYPALVVVGSEAVDADTGRVGSPYTMRAPKDAVSLVTPLTTLVQSMVDATGSSTQEAAAAVQYLLDMRNSPLDNFTSNGDTHAQAIANAVVVTTQKQGDMLRSAVGQRTSSGAFVTQADIDKLVAQKILSFGYWFAFAARHKDVTSTTHAIARVAALRVLAQAKLDSDGIASAAPALTALGHIQQSQPDNSFLSGMASAWLVLLRFDAPDDVHALHAVSSAAENTPVANTIQYRSLHYRNYPNGDVATWATSDAASVLHWTGSSWSVCSIHGAHTASVPDANGTSSYNHCEGLERGTTHSRTVDISGQKMLDVYQSMQSQGYSNLRIGASSTAAASLLGAAVFPGGSRMALKQARNASYAFAYYPGTGNRLELPNAQLAAGNAVACDAASFVAATGPVTLEAMVSSLRGTPCIYAPWSANEGLNGATLDTGSKNEAWGNTTLGLGILGSAQTVGSLNQASTFYTGNISIRVAFGDAGLAKYYTCQESWGGGVRNCTPAGSGRYVLDSLGDARVLHFTDLPQILQGAKTWERVFIERGGQVFYGYRDLPYPTASAWLNLPAANALSALLGIRTIQPADPLALTLASYEGTYKGIFSSEAGSTLVSGLFTFRLTAGQAPSCSGTSNALASTSNPAGTFTCANIVLDPGAPGSTQASISFGITSSGERFTGTVNYYTGNVSGTWSNTAGLQGSFTGLRE